MTLYLGRRFELRDSILQHCGLKSMPNAGSIHVLADHLSFGALICRSIYIRQEEPLPDADDIVELGTYWKKYYNTPLGKGTVEHFVKQYRSHGE